MLNKSAVACYLPFQRTATFPRWKTNFEEVSLAIDSNISFRPELPEAIPLLALILTNLFLRNCSDSSEIKASEIPSLPILMETPSWGFLADLSIDLGMSLAINHHLIFLDSL